MLNCAGKGLICTAPVIGSASDAGTPMEPPTNDFTANVSDWVDPGALLETSASTSMSPVAALNAFFSVKVVMLLRASVDARPS
jgi:hypothetical protein